tara:strand:- start:214 stop:459 length:246 start_codon:yes stop_codon:yes gene_type:complete
VCQKFRLLFDFAIQNTLGIFTTQVGGNSVRVLAFKKFCECLKHGKPPFLLGFSLFKITLLQFCDQVDFAAKTTKVWQNYAT